MTLRWKLFAIISLSVAIPVTALTVYFPTAQIAAQEEALTGKAVAFARMSEEDVRAAVAFDDSQTAAEEFASTGTDPDVALLALFRANGTLLESHGQGDLRPPPATDTLVVSRHDDRVRVVTPVVSVEGPRGVLVVELSTTRLRAEGARWRRTAVVVAALALLFGLVAAWVVGRSFGRRISRVTAHALRVADGDLSASPRTDTARDEIGQLAGVFHTMVKTVERLVAERTEALHASREQLRGLLETTHAVPWQMRPDELRFTYVGPQAAAVLGGASDAWLAPDFWQTRVSAEEAAAVRAAFREAEAGHASRESEFRLLRDDGRPTWIRILVSCGRDGDASILRGFMFDVTERRRLEVELQLAQRLQSVGRLAAGVAHEINTPVQFVGDSLFFVRDAVADLARLVAGYQAVVRSVADGTPSLAAAEAVTALEAETDLAYLQENIPKALERSIGGLNRVAAIVGSMKELSHPEQKEMTDVDLNALLENTLTMARSEYKYVADVELELGTLPMVTCHAGDISQALLNLLVNAAQAITGVVKDTGERGQLKIRTEHAGDAVVIAISDTGGGIPTAIRDQVFDLFFTTKELGKGTGQGLAIARAVSEKHGGALTFQTEEGRGTTFTLRLPVAAAQPATVALRATA